MRRGGTVGIESGGDRKKTKQRRESNIIPPVSGVLEPRAVVASAESQSTEAKVLVSPHLQDLSYHCLTGNAYVLFLKDDQHRASCI
jgi:hypothetical protein